MPQLDPASYTSQLFWLVISFGMLWVGLYLSLPDLERIFKKRRTYVVDKLKKARNLSKETDERTEAQAAQLRASEKRSKDALRKALTEHRGDLERFKAAAEREAQQAERQEKEALFWRYRDEEENLQAHIPELTKMLSKTIERGGKGS